MDQTPLHVHVMRLIKHVSTTQLNLTTPSDEVQLQKRLKKKERHNKKTRQLLQNLQNGLNAKSKS